jgi:AraC-like DNA-binding protein
MLASLPARWLMNRRALPDGFDPAVLQAQGVEVATQRSLLARVAEVGGETTLLSLGRGLLQTRDQPLMFVMLNSSSVADFIDKEQRFNRFFHTDHRVRVHELRDDLLELEHGGPREVPHRHESLFVLGLHLASLRELGCTGLQCTLPMSQEPRAPLLRDSRVLRPPAGGAHVWRFSWTRFSPKRAPLAGLDDLLLHRHPPSDFATQHNADEAVQRVVETDLAKRWMIGEVARALSMSPRTLQRGLSARGTSFSAVVEQARVSEATRLLRDSKRSITEVGYVCGFADTAHFSRRFKVCTGKTPTAFQKRA